MPWSSWLLLPSSVVLSTGKVNSLSGPATATGGLLFSAKLVFSVWHFLDSHWQGLPIRFYTGYFNKILIYWFKRYKSQVWRASQQVGEVSSAASEILQQLGSQIPHQVPPFFIALSGGTVIFPKILLHAQCIIWNVPKHAWWSIILVPPVHPFQNLQHKNDSLPTEKILTHSVCCSRPLSKCQFRTFENLVKKQSVTLFSASTFATW